MTERIYGVTGYVLGTANAKINKIVHADTSGPAIDYAEDLAAKHPALRFVVTNDRGRALAAFEDGEYEYLGY